MRLQEFQKAPQEAVRAPVTAPGGIPGQMTVEECIAEVEAPQYEKATTPSGLQIYYQWAPKRLYCIGPRGIDLAEVPSVTTVLGVLDRSGPLSWWAQGISAEGVCELVRRGLLVMVGDAV